MSDRTRMTPAELDKATSALVGKRASLPPAALLDMVNFHAQEAADRLADLWTLRDSLNAERSGPDHAAAVGHMAELAEHYGNVLDTVRRMATALDVPLDLDAPGRVS